MSAAPPAFCSACGARLTSGHAFCSECGQALAAEQPVAPTPPLAPRPTQTRSAPGGRGGLLLLLALVTGALGLTGAVLFQQLRRTAQETKPGSATATAPSPTAILPTPSIQPTPRAEPVGPPIRSNTPVEVAYRHFLDEVHRRTKGNLRVGTPKSTPTRIEVVVTAPNGPPDSLVVLEKSNNGAHATVVVGPKDAGAARSYTLVFGREGWTIGSFEDLDG